MKKHLSLALLFCAPISQSLYALEGELTPERMALLKHLAAIESFDQAEQLKTANTLVYSDVTVFVEEQTAEANLSAAPMQETSLAEKILLMNLTPAQAKEKIEALVAAHAQQAAEFAKMAIEVNAKEAFKLQRANSLERHGKAKQDLESKLNEKSQEVKEKSSTLETLVAEVNTKKLDLESARSKQAATKEEANAFIEHYNALQSGVTGWFKTYSKIS